MELHHRQDQTEHQLVYLIELPEFEMLKLILLGTLVLGWTCLDIALTKLKFNKIPKMCSPS